MSYHFKLSAVLCVSLLLLYASGLSAVVINVPVDFTSIQAAINAASSGDKVVVAPGSYIKTVNFDGKAITLRSSRNDPEDTIIDANGSGSVVTCESGETAATILQGFTLTGGDSTYGGGMFNLNSSPTVTNCIFYGNTASYGGGMYASGSDLTITNCTFSGNTAGSGGGVRISDCSPTVTSCTFSTNRAENSDGGGVYNIWGNPTITNCILWGNSSTSSFGSQLYQEPVSVITVTYSCVQGGRTGEGNIDSAPLFVDANGPDDDLVTWQDNNLRLTAESPCIDVGNNAAIPAGIVTDLDGKLRIGSIDGVDMGAYEFQPFCDDLCPFAENGDINCDGIVDILDLAILSAHWLEGSE